ncbi:hypothetical protein D3C81_1548160 [compost metagenome]
MPARLGEHFFCNHSETFHILTSVVNLQQLQANGLTLWVLLQRFAQDFFCLHVAPVGDIHLRLGDRVHLGGFRRVVANPEIGAKHAVLRGIHALAAGGAEQRMATGHHRAFLRQDAVAEATVVGGLLLLAAAIDGVTAQQRDQ